MHTKNCITHRLLAVSLCLIGIYYSIPPQNAQAMISRNEHCLQPSEDFKFKIKHSLDLDISPIPVGISEDTAHYLNRPSIAWSPDGRLFARKRLIEPEQNTSILQIFDSGTGDVVIQVKVEGRAKEMAWSPDGQYLAFSILLLDKNETKVQLINLETQASQTVELEKKVESISRKFGIMWSSDSLHFTIVGNFEYSRRSGHSLHIISLQGPSARGRVIYESNSSLGIISALAWHPNGQSLAISYGRKIAVANMAELDAESHLELTVADDPAHVYWLQDQMLISVSIEGIFLLDVTSKEVTHIALDLDLDAILSHNKQYLAVRVYDDPDVAHSPVSAITRVFDLEKKESIFETPYGLFDGGKPWFRIVWSPDDQYLALNDAFCGLYVYAVATGELMFHTSLVEPDRFGLAFGFDWSPDSRYLAMSGESGNFRIIDIENQREVALIEHGSEAQFVFWNPNGRRILMEDGSGEFMIELED
ncbi:MAG: WD40 repeat domain-containing protein [Cyanobacteria bacterium P01_G01_bin.54]